MSKPYVNEVIISDAELSEESSGGNLFVLVITGIVGFAVFAIGGLIDSIGWGWRLCLGKRLKLPKADPYARPSDENDNYPDD